MCIRDSNVPGTVSWLFLIVTAGCCSSQKLCSIAVDQAVHWSKAASWSLLSHSSKLQAQITEEGIALPSTCNVRNYPLVCVRFLVAVLNCCVLVTCMQRYFTSTIHFIVTVCIVFSTKVFLLLLFFLIRCPIGATLHRLSSDLAGRRRPLRSFWEFRPRKHEKLHNNLENGRKKLFSPHVDESLGQKLWNLQR